MFFVILGDIHTDNLQNIFPYATMNITKNKEKLFEKHSKNYLGKISTNLNFWLDFYKVHNKQLVEIRSLLKFSIL